MSSKNVIVCDQCSKERGQTNRWFVMRIDGGADGPHIEIYEHATVVTKYDDDKDLCGESCVAKAVQNWMAKQKG